MARLMSLYVSGTVLGGFLGRFLLGHLSEIMGWRGVLCDGGLEPGQRVFRGRAARFEKYFCGQAQNPNCFANLERASHNRYVLTAGALGACVLFSLAALPISTFIWPTSLMP